MFTRIKQFFQRPIVKVVSMDDVVNYVTNPATNPRFYQQQGPKYDPNKGYPTPENSQPNGNSLTEAALTELTQAVEQPPLDVNAAKMDIIKRKSGQLGG